MERRPEPQPTVFQKFGGSIYMKIPSDRVQFLGLTHLLKENTENKTKGKCQAEKNSNQENYISGWNPNHPSQQGEE